MALNWDARNVRDWHELHNTAPKGEEPKFEKGSPEDLEGDRQWGISNDLIWATIGVDMGEIKESNYEEFYRRLVMLGKVYGSPYTITLYDVKRRIGLSTNVITESKTKFENKMKKLLMEHADRELLMQKRLLAEYEELCARDDLDEKEEERKEKLRVEHIEPHVEKWRKRADEIAAEREGAGT